MAIHITEATVEEMALGWLHELGWSIAHGQDIAPDAPAAERVSYGDVVLAGRLREALSRINPGIPPAALEEAARKVMRPESASLVENNRRFHRFLTDGVPVEYADGSGRLVSDIAWPIDFREPARNDWLAAAQFTVIEHRHNRRPDIVLFVNGLPLAAIELKAPTDENATIRKAFNQLQTYKEEIPSLFASNEVLVVSDGLEARIGALTADWERFMPLRTVEGDALAPPGTLELETLIRGVFERGRFLDLIRHFAVFETDGPSVEKKLAAYHQFHAVTKAVESTVRAASADGDRRAGVVWHTQGSGKSLSMAFYAGKIIVHAAMQNPTLVVLTDRNDLDDQLFGTFAGCADLLRQTPQQASDRDNLRDLLRVASGGSPASTRPPCTRCTWTSRCAATA